jgi:hypothetical protein
MLIKGQALMTKLSILLFGSILCAGGFSLFDYAWREEYRQLGDVMRKNSTIDPTSPPRIVMRNMPGGTHFTNEGGLAKHTPTAGFTNYEDAIQKIRHELRILRWSGDGIAILGLMMMFGSFVAHFLIR